METKQATDSAFQNGDASIDSVRQWRETVEMFFAEDWEHLRGLILDLEESIWTEDELDKKREEAANAKAVPTELLQAINHGEVETKDDQGSPDAAAEPEETESADRLLELSRKVEARIQAQRGMGDTREIHLD